MPEQSDSIIHIAICDDEAADRGQTEILVKEIMGDEGITVAISIYESAVPLLAAIKGGAFAGCHQGRRALPDPSAGRDDG